MGGRAEGVTSLSVQNSCEKLCVLWQLILANTGEKGRQEIRGTGCWNRAFYTLYEIYVHILSFCSYILTRAQKTCRPWLFNFLTCKTFPR
jgi:hypothetical protein